MIIVKLKGGLGNQMFQYAMGRSLSHFHGMQLKFDILTFPDHNQRVYALDKFNVDIQNASQNEIFNLKYQSRNFFNKILRRAPKKSSNYIQEKDFILCKKILSINGSVYIDGYWQSEKYFEDIKEIIRHDFSIKHPIKGKNKKCSEIISSCDSVSMHIRRGDYVSNHVTNNIHGICDTTYYKYCVDLIRQRLKSPHFFIFSDEPEWVHENINLDFPITIVDHNTIENAFEDMCLMSLCQHNIIANSSFSWWGAWLNSNPHKIVIAPQRWFADKNKNIKTTDLVPDRWLRL